VGAIDVKVTISCNECMSIRILWVVVSKKQTDHCKK